LAEPLAEPWLSPWLSAFLVEPLVELSRSPFRASQPLPRLNILVFTTRISLLYLSSVNFAFVSRSAGWLPKTTMMQPVFDPDYSRRPFCVVYPRRIHHPGGMCALPDGGIAFCDAPLFQRRAVCVVEPDGSAREFFRHDFNFIAHARRPWAIAACSNGDFLVTDAVFGKLIRISSTGDIRWITPPDSPPRTAHSAGA
jgi:hypothetical protein